MTAGVVVDEVALSHALALVLCPCPCPCACACAAVAVVAASVGKTLAEIKPELRVQVLEFVLV